MPGRSGLEALQQIKQHKPSLPVLVLSIYPEEQYAIRVLKAGAAGYLLKSSLIDELLNTIRIVHSGRRYIPAELAQEIAIHAGEEPLSDREIAILQLVAAGKQNKVIAWEMSVSEETVKAHMRNIFSKLDVSDRTQAVTRALKRGIITL
jgi:DNA-binding NarL/FixJ family response regulator